MKKTLYPVLICLIALSFIATALPVFAQVQEGMGCCQFEGEEPGCWYPTDVKSCTNLDGKFLEGEKKCSMETGYCSGYKKDGESSSDSKKK